MVMGAGQGQGQVYGVEYLPVNVALPFAGKHHCSRGRTHGAGPFAAPTPGRNAPSARRLPLLLPDHAPGKDGMSIETAETASTITRISDDRAKWRVVVQAWPDEPGYRGRLVFEPDGIAAPLGAREGPPALHGRTREDVVSQAYELPERELRTMLLSLG